MVDAIHRLAAALKQAGGITFMDKNGNIRNDRRGRRLLA